MRKLQPAWFLFLIAPLTAEYMSGSSPSFNPIILLVNMVLYGCGVLMIRELRTRWNKGWLAVFLLSIAYTVAEEGLMLNTLFDPLKNTDGRALGVNWVWTTGMFIVHSWISIFIPISLAEAVYPDKAREQWVRPSRFYLLLVAFTCDVLLVGHLLAPKNRPGAAYYILEFVIIGAAICAAFRVPGPKSGSVVGHARSPRWFYFAAFIGTILTLAVSFLIPSAHLPTLVKIALMLGAYLAVLAFLARNDAFSSTAPLIKLALAGGVMLFWMIASPLITIVKRDPVPILVAIGMGIILVKTRKQLRRNQLQSAPDSAG